MNKYIVVDNNYSERIQTDFEYEVGEVLRYNSDSQIKCVDIKIEDGEALYKFKEARKVFIYD